MIHRFRRRWRRSGVCRCRGRWFWRIGGCFWLLVGWMHELFVCRMDWWMDLWIDGYITEMCICVWVCFYVLVIDDSVCICICCVCILKQDSKKSVSFCIVCNIVSNDRWSIRWFTITDDDTCIHPYKICAYVITKTLTLLLPFQPYWLHHLHYYS